MKKIFKIAAVVVEDDKFLMVRKTGKEIWTNLGGKPEAGEDEKQALIREVKEELGCQVVIRERLGAFENKAVFDDAIVHISFYLVDLIGDPNILDEELEEFKYIGHDYAKQNIQLPATITDQLIPLLIEKRYLNWETS